MATSNTERLIYAEIQKKLFYMIPERWDAIYLYASIIEENNKKPFGEMYFYYIPKGILKRKPVNVYEIPGLFNIEEESYNDLIQKLYLDIKRLRIIHKEVKDEIWSNLTITIQNSQFKIEFFYEDLGSQALFTPYERHIIWRYNNLNDFIITQSREEKSIIERYLNSSWNRSSHIKDVYVEGIYKNQARNIIDYERTMTIEAAIAAQRAEESEITKEKKKEKKKASKNEKVIEDNSNQILFGRLENMRKVKEKMDNEKSSKNSKNATNKKENETNQLNSKKSITGSKKAKHANTRVNENTKTENDFDDDMILSSDFMTKK